MANPRSVSGQENVVGSLNYLVELSGANNKKNFLTSWETVSFFKKDFSPWSSLIGYLVNEDFYVPRNKSKNLQSFLRGRFTS